MKKNNKTLIGLLCIALACIAIGGTLIGIGFSQGGNINIASKRIGVFNIPSWHHDASSKEIHKYTPSMSVTKLSLDVSAASIEIQRGSEFSISTKRISKSDIEFHEDATTATLKTKNDTWSTNMDHEIYITLPDTVKELDIDANLGDIDIQSGLNITRINLKLNAGDVDIENMNVEVANFDLDLGDFDFSGDFSKSFTYDNNAGDTDISLRHPQMYYDFDASGNLGNFEIGDKSLSGINGSYQQSNNTGRLLKVNVDLGNLNVEFMDMDD